MCSHYVGALQPLCYICHVLTVELLWKDSSQCIACNFSFVIAGYVSAIFLDKNRILQTLHETCIFPIANKNMREN